MDYQSRTADAQLAEMLAGLPAILIEGVRAVGKTETARRVCADEMLLDDPNVYEMVRNNPFAAVTGWREPLLVDEWQHIGPVFDGVRRQVDEDYRPGRFVLTGSARPERITVHSGAGRIAVLRMRPMTLPEGSRWIDGAVINTGSFAHRRQDGIAVIPLALLGP